MRRRWYYFKWVLRTNRLVVLGLAGFLVLGYIMFGNRDHLVEMLGAIYEQYGVMAAGAVMEGWIPDMDSDDERGLYRFVDQPEVMKYLEELPETRGHGEDPAYERMLANAWEQRILEENEDGAWQQSGESARNADGNNQTNENAQSGTTGGGDRSNSAETGDTEAAASQIVKETINIKPSGTYVIREKLADYDYLMKNFYSVHPTTSASRNLVSAESFLSMDLSLEKQTDQPQILIYHTHSQETFADYPQNENATIVGVGAYLAELLENKGYQVIHDTTVYDVRDGTLDRSRAYTYALDGITGILQEHPTIEVVLDVHRDGVGEKTHLVTEVNGKPTAQIMFFNGTSQTPDGPIEYLPNPNREANMAFSFQMQLKAAEQYPGFTRKIYLKGLRYNQHVRARTALIEVGAQTNTYAEALNAMEPLADILNQVLDGE